MPHSILRDTHVIGEPGDIAAGQAMRQSQSGE
jgi:hypothetical protein